VVPATLTAYPVAPTPDLISAATDGPAIWADTGSTLTRLQVKTPTSTQHTLQNTRSYPRRGHMQATAPGIRTGSSARLARHHLARQSAEPIRRYGVLLGWPLISLLLA
jgi:hypothetical protein